MVLYILNSPILTSYGKYEFSKISLDYAKELLSFGDFVSAIGHEATANLLSKITGAKIPVNRVRIEMEPGDIAIVFRVLTRLPEGKILTEEELEKIPYELGLLERVE